MKNNVIKVLQDKDLKPQAQFNQLFALYRTHPMPNRALINSYNRLGYSLQQLEMLKYDTMKLYGINQSDLRRKVKVVNLKKKSIDKTKFSEGLTPEMIQHLQEIFLPEANYHKEIKPLANEIAKALEIDMPDQKKDTLIDFLNQQKEALLKKNLEESNNEEE